MLQLPPDSQAAMADQFTPPDGAGAVQVPVAAAPGAGAPTAGAGAGAGVAARAARFSQALRGCHGLSVSRWPTRIICGLCTLCRFTHHSAGQVAALPYWWRAMLDRVSPCLTV